MLQGRVKFVEHTADLEFDAEAGGLDGLFEICAQTLFQAMMEEDLTRTVVPRVNRTILAEGKDLEALLYSFLEKLLILHDSERMVFSVFSFKEFVETKTGWTCECECGGETWDSRKMTGTENVKAVTYHDMKVRKDTATGLWTARVLLDI